VVALEHQIDSWNQDLPDLRSFVLPGGGWVAAYLHLARTVCRRAERLVVTLAAQEPVGAHVLPYLNRLSDLLFVLARKFNQDRFMGVLAKPYNSGMLLSALQKFGIVPTVT
jgi:cob(I)alamin adenosyltransferase